MQKNNVKIIVSYLDIKTQEKKTTFGYASILPLNDFNELEMGASIAKEIAINHIGHENFSVIDFKVECI
jgi:hypothetical protein